MNWTARDKTNLIVGRLDDRTKGFIKINTILLMKTFNYKSSLVPIDADITVVFQFEHPFTTHNILRWGRRYQNPSGLSSEGIKFLIHDITPLLMLSSNLK